MRILYIPQTARNEWRGSGGVFYRSVKPEPLQANNFFTLPVRLLAHFRSAMVEMKNWTEQSRTELSDWTVWLNCLTELNWTNVLIDRVCRVAWGALYNSIEIFDWNVRLNCSIAMFDSNVRLKCSFEMFAWNIRLKYSIEMFDWNVRSN